MLERAQEDRARQDRRGYRDYRQMPPREAYIQRRRDTKGYHKEIEDSYQNIDGPRGGYATNQPLINPELFDNNQRFMYYTPQQTHTFQQNPQPMHHQQVLHHQRYSMQPQQPIPVAPQPHYTQMYAPPQHFQQFPTYPPIQNPPLMHQHSQPPPQQPIESGPLEGITFYERRINRRLNEERPQEHRDYYQ